MPPISQKCRKPPHNATWGFTVVLGCGSNRDRQLLAEKTLPKKLRLILRLSKLFERRPDGTLSLFQRRKYFYVAILKTELF